MSSWISKQQLYLRDHPLLRGTEWSWHVGVNEEENHAYVTASGLSLSKANWLVQSNGPISWSHIMLSSNADGSVDVELTYEN